MKRAKIAFTALAALFFTGAFLAFKAHQFEYGKFYVHPYTATTTTGVQCTLTSNVSITIPSMIGAKKVYFRTVGTLTTTTTICPTSTFTYTITGNDDF